MTHLKAAILGLVLIAAVGIAVFLTGPQTPTCMALNGCPALMASTHP